MRWKPLFLSVFCAAVLLAPVAPAGAQNAQSCTAENTVFAHVVALDQAISNNRLGATLPGGMIFALARDVCAPGTGLVNGQQPCSGQAPAAGNVIVKPYKRPRPITLRVNQGQCLQIGFTNLLNATTPPPEGNTTTRAASVHVQGLELTATSTCGNTGTGPTCNDGSWVGKNPSGLVSPLPSGSTLDLTKPQITYTLYAAQEGAFLLYSAGDTYSSVNGNGDGGQLAFGLFGAVHVEPAGAEWYRSQVTADDLAAARRSEPSKYGQPLINYQAVYSTKPSDACFTQGTCRVGPVLRMACTAEMARKPDFQCKVNEIVHSDLTAVISGPATGRFPAQRPETPQMRSTYALPDRLQPFREFTIIYHESFQIQQAFAPYYAAAPAQGNPTAGGAGQDQFGINYGFGGIGSEVLANRLGVGPMGNCPSCKFEEFFLTSWAVGDPAMVVDNPPGANCQAGGTNGITCTGGPATQAFFPDDPSNVYHSYIADHTKFRILHGGSDLHHVHHQHAHQWLHSPDTSNGDYLDSQSIGPGSSFSLEMTYNGSGNVNQTVGDSIFHCHFYPHFAGGMWSMWRVHDVYETGTLLGKDGKPRTDVPNRALPDGEIATGTPTPAVIPLPTIPMPPMPGPVRLAENGTQVTLCDDQGNNCIPALSATAQNPSRYKNPGFPFFIPGVAGQRAPHPPLDFAKADDGSLLDGGLPRHLILACPEGQTCAEIAPLDSFTDFSKTLTNVKAIELPEAGTFVEQLAMRFHSQRLVDSVTPENKTETVNGYDPSKLRPAQFVLNGMKPAAGAPFSDPCVKYSLEGGSPPWHAMRRYKAADIQLDVSFNRDGWHYPQQRMISLWGDVQSFLKGEKAPEPFFFRANSGDCIEYVLANLVPNVYELDDFQVRTPTDIIGQHIHLVKFDVTSSDGATNGFNYEDGTFAPNEVTERIVAINAGGGLGGKPSLTAKTLPFFGPGPGGQWVGAQATVQRWYTDRLFDGTLQKPGVDRTLRTVFTHDHFGPSTHQQAGLYAGLVIEPEDARWYRNEGRSTDQPFGGDDGSGKPLPSRTVTGYNGATTRDGGPTTWQAVIVPAGNPNASFREFLLEFQDTMLAYEAFKITPPASQGFCSDNGASCQPATPQNMKPGLANCKNPKTAVCYAYGFCSNDTSKTCKPATATAQEDLSSCGLAPGAYATCNRIAGIPSSTWKTTPLDNGDGLELVTLQNSTYSFSVNYRNEPLFLRIDDAQGTPLKDKKAGDLSYAYSSIARPGSPLAQKGPYPPLTPGVGPYDPFTPLLRAYAGDDVQIRTLVGAHINPHNFTVHGIKWLAEPSFVDSGWRNSQVMGISEHFEEVFRVPAVTSDRDRDYLYMSGAAATEQGGGSWGLLRAYGKPLPDLMNLPQNRNLVTAPVCDPKAPVRRYTVVALTAKQALPGGQLTYNTRGSLADPNAILYFQLQDLDCSTPSMSCKAKLGPNGAEPLVLRANAGDCLQVTLYNMIQGPLAAGASFPVNYCGSASSPVACTSNTSTNVGLHPQLATFDVRFSNGFNAGINPDQVVQTGKSRVYTWYAGNIDPKAPAGQRHIPIEFGASNLLPSDVINHHQYGLFGALIIEPPGSQCILDSGKVQPIEACRRTSATIRSADQSFRELVLITQDGLSGPANRLLTPYTLGTAWLNGDQLNAVNYRSELLFLPKGGGGFFRSCSTGDLSCVLSNTAQCCTSATTKGTCSTWEPCGEPQTPIFEACAGEQVRFRVLHPGGINTNQVFEIYGHNWQEQPYMSTGKGCPKPAPTTQTSLWSSSRIGTKNGCDPLEQDTYSEFQGSRMGHGPTNHFDVLIPSAGGANKVPGDYLYRTYPAMHYRLGLWGVFRVNSCPAAQTAEAMAVDEGGEGR
jgi:manganese oxidase